MRCVFIAAGATVLAFGTNWHIGLGVALLAVAQLPRRVS